MSIISSLLGQLTPGTSVGGTTVTPDSNSISNLLSGTNSDLLKLLKEYFQSNPKLVEKDGLIGFDVSGLTQDQVTQFQTALQNALDDEFGGALQLSLGNNNLLGIETTGLSDKDKTSLTALLENLSSLGSGLTTEQKTVVAAAITGVLAAESLVIISGSGTNGLGGADGAGSSGSQVQIPAPPPSYTSAQDYAYLAGLLTIEAAQAGITATQTTNEILGNIQKNDAEETMKAIIKTAQAQADNAQKAQISKIFGWITSIALIIIGAILTVAGALLAWTGGGVGVAAAGVGLVVGGVIGCVLASDAGTKLTTDLVNALSKSGVLSKAAATALAAVIIAVATIVICLVATAGVGAIGAIGSAIGSLASAGTTTATVTAETTAEATTTAVSTTAETATEAGGGVADAAGAGAESASTTTQVVTAFINNVKRIQTVIQVALGLVNVATSSAQGATELQLGNAEKEYLKDVASSKEVANTIGLLIKELSSLLESLQSGVSNAAGVLAEVPTIASFSAGRSA